MRLKTVILTVLATAGVLALSFVSTDGAKADAVETETDSAAKVGSSETGNQSAREFWREHLRDFEQRMQEARPGIRVTVGAAPDRPRPYGGGPGSSLAGVREAIARGKYGDWYRIDFDWPDRDYSTQEKALIVGYQLDYDYNDDGTITTYSNRDIVMHGMRPTADESLSSAPPNVGILRDVQKFYEAEGRLPGDTVALLSAVHPPESLADTGQKRLDELMVNYLDTVNYRIIDLQVEDPEQAKSGDVFIHAWTEDELAARDSLEFADGDTSTEAGKTPTVTFDESGDPVRGDSPKSAGADGQIFYLRRYRDGGILHVWEQITFSRRTAPGN